MLRWTKRPGTHSVQRGASQRGASPMQRHCKEPREPGALISLAKRLPWRSIGLHSVLFSFWLVVLGGGGYLLSLADREIEQVQLQTELQHQPGALIDETLAPYRHQSFFGVDLDRLQKDLLSQPWVREVSVFRIWPNAIGVTIEEHVPVAHWGRDGLVSNEGILFRPADVWRDEALPDLEGPVGSHEEVFARLQQWQPSFMELGLALTGIRKDERGAWTLEVDHRWTIELGRQKTEERLAIFLNNYQSVLQGQEERIARVDMRYSRGMAVRWLPGQEAAAETRTGS